MQITTKYDVGDETNKGTILAINVRLGGYSRKQEVQYWVKNEDPLSSGDWKFYTEDELSPVCDHGLVDIERVVARRFGRRFTWTHCPECGETL